MMNLDEVKALLPHREPFLFIDGVTRLEPGRIEAYRDLRPEEFYFSGHFPGNPVFPGVLMVEAIAQTGILLVLIQADERRGRKTLFAAIKEVRFKRIVRPGERLILTAELMGGRAGVYKLHGTALVSGELACEATVTGALRD